MIRKKEDGCIGLKGIGMTGFGERKAKEGMTGGENNLKLEGQDGPLKKSLRTLIIIVVKERKVPKRMTGRLTSCVIIIIYQSGIYMNI